MPRSRTRRSRGNTHRTFPLLLALAASPLAATLEPVPAPRPPAGDSGEAIQEKPEEMVPRRELVAAQARLDEVTQRLVEAYRMLFLRLPEAERSAFLADLMNGGRSASPDGPEPDRPPLPHPLRELAYDLATAEVVSARPLGPSLIEAASTGLADPRAGVRAKAAGLLAKLDASPVLDSVYRALGKEDHPEAAVEMLSIIARHPRPEAAELVMARLAHPEQTRPVVIAAINAMLAIQRAHPLTDPEAIEAVRSAVGDLASGDLTPNAVRLLASLGATDAVRKLISSADAQICRAAAQSLVGDPDSLDLILEHARKELALFDVAVEALILHEASAAGFARAGALPAPSPEKRSEMLVQLAAALPPADLLTVASAPMDLTERERLLATIATPGELEKLAQEEHRTDERRLLIESLVRTRLQLKNAAGALRVIQSLPTDDRSGPLVQDEVTALIWLNRLDEAVDRAAGLGTPQGPEVWLNTLEKIETLDHAPTALHLCASTYEAELTEAQKQRLASLAERLSALHPEPEDQIDAGPTASETERIGPGGQPASGHPAGDETVDGLPAGDRPS